VPVRFLAVTWIGQCLLSVATGAVPQLITDAGGAGTHMVAALDLTTIVPPLVLGAVLLWRSRPWGYVVGAAMLVQSLLIVVDLVITPAFQAAAGIVDAWTMVPVWTGMGVTFLAGAILLLRRVAPAGTVPPPVGAPSELAR
jgi:hypothetical protein